MTKSKCRKGMATVVEGIRLATKENLKVESSKASSHEQLFQPS